MTEKNAPEPPRSVLDLPLYHPAEDLGKPAATPTGTPRSEVSELLGKYLNTMVSDLGIDGKGQYLRDLFSKYEAELSGAPTGTGEGSEPWLTTKANREAAVWAGEGLAEDFEAGTWENTFVANLAKDAERAIVENASLRSQLEEAQRALEDTEGAWKVRCEVQRELERDLATAQDRIALATTFLRRADATSTQNELYDLVDEARQALAEPQSGEK